MNIGVILGAKLVRDEIIGIVTDLPDMISNSSNFINSCYSHIKRCDGYVLLADAVNDIVNPDRSEPFVVIEGQVDSAMGKLFDDNICKATPKVCMYAGNLNKENGIDYLVDGFLKADIIGWELHIYGQGDYVDELKKFQVKILVLQTEKITRIFKKIEKKFAKGENIYNNINELSDIHCVS